MKRKIIYYAAGILCVMITLTAAFYPTVSNYFADKIHDKQIKYYEQEVQEISENYNEIWDKVDDYNKSLIARAGEDGKIDFNKGEPGGETYRNLLNVDGYGMMGYIEIPAINIKLPIYHGTGEKELAAGVGHLEGSSLPGGGKGTHTVLSSHSGYSQAVLFDDLHKLQKGDTFTITVLDRKLTYEVDQIATVIPSDTSLLVFDPDQDYVTLFTCTPYGVNSHRLLVRGVRVDKEKVGSE